MPVRTRLVLGCLLAVLLAVPALVPRVAAENAVDQVRLGVVDSDLRTWTGHRQGEGRVVGRLAEAGVGTVVLGMRPIRDLMADRAAVEVDVDLVPGSVPRALRPGTGAGEGRDGKDSTVLRGRPGDPDGAFARIVAVLRARYGHRVRALTRSSPAGGVPYVRVSGVRDLADVPVGYDPARARRLAADGVQVLLALPSRLPAGREWLERQLLRTSRTSGARTVLALGPMPFGERPADRVAFAEFLRRHDLRLAVPDLGAVPGAAAYGARLPGKILRVHLIAMGSRPDAGTLHSLAVRGRRAQKERGVRLIVLRSPAQDPDARLDLGAVTGLARRLTENAAPGLAVTTAGSSRPMPAVEPGLPARAATVVAALLVLALAGARLLGIVVPLPGGRRARLPAWGLGAGVVAAAAVGVAGLAAGSMTGPMTGTMTGSAPGPVTGGTAAVQALGLVTAVAGSVLAVLAAAPDEAGPAGRSGRLPGILTRYAVAVGVAVTTGLVVAALGSRSLFLLGLEGFAGVKLLLVAPPLLAGAVLALRSRARTGGAGSLRGWWSRVGPWHVALAAAVTAVAAYYLVRSGNSGTAPGFELRVRDALDEALYIRPRFKEALIGFPALAVLAGWRWRSARWVPGVVAAVGTAGAVDTFSHFHTPLGAELLRTGYGAVAGLVLGLIVLAVLRGVARPRDGR